MFSKLAKMFIEVIKEINNYPTILIILGIGIFALLLDGPRYKKRGYIKEVKIIKGIFYTHMLLGGIMYILLLIM